MHLLCCVRREKKTYYRTIKPLKCLLSDKKFQHSLMVGMQDKQMHFMCNLCAKREGENKYLEARYIEYHKVAHYRVFGNQNK